MSDQRRSQPTSPHLRTRPGTLLTAIGLCAIIVLIQLAPELQGLASPLAAPTTVSSAR
jgi:hypothetical protein